MMNLLSETFTYQDNERYLWRVSYIDQRRIGAAYRYKVKVWRCDMLTDQLIFVMEGDQPPTKIDSRKMIGKAREVLVKMDA